MHLLLITFNAGQTSPKNSIINFVKQFNYTLEDKPDIIAIGIQEGLRNCLKDFNIASYETFYYNQVWAPTGIGSKSNSWQSWLFLKKYGLQATINDKYFSCEKSGANRAIGLIKNSLRKGFGIFKLSVLGMEINIGIGHLPSKEDNPLKRDICLRKTQNMINRGDVNEYNFIMGDLNYRRIITSKDFSQQKLQQDIQRKLLLTFLNPIIISGKSSRNIYKLNQLRNISKRRITDKFVVPSNIGRPNNYDNKGNSFDKLMGYREADFPDGAPPTCKLDVKSARNLGNGQIEIMYDRKRIPSFCDRIIYQSNEKINVLFYEPIFLYGDNGELSDHLGVAGLFQFGNQSLQKPMQTPIQTMRYSLQRPMQTMSQSLQEPTMQPLATNENENEEGNEYENMGNVMGERDIPEYFVNVNRNVDYYNVINQENTKKNIKQYIAENPNNIVITYGNNQFFFTDRSTIERQKSDAEVYPCKTVDTLRPDNIMRGILLYNFRMIGLLDGSFCDMKLFYQNRNHQLFAICDTDKTFPSFVSKKVLDGGNNVVSGLHCQAGQNGRVSILVPAFPKQRNSPPSYNNSIRNSPPSYNNGVKNSPPSYNNSVRNSRKNSLPSYNNSVRNSRKNSPPSYNNSVRNSRKNSLPRYNNNNSRKNSLPSYNNSLKNSRRNRPLRNNNSIVQNPVSENKEMANATNRNNVRIRMANPTNENSGIENPFN